jgi:YidC/Oxa1 family membrane protein insertase
MLALAPWQWLLDGVGWVLAEIYKFIPQYGVALILLTVLIRLVLFPLGIKQIRSMYAMQAIQPKMKALQQKYKNDRTKLNEEMMKLYQEHGVNPLGGCLPMLIQMPVFIAMFSVLHFPAYGRYTPNHLPDGSSLRVHIDQATWIDSSTNQLRPGTPGTNMPTMPFLGANLLCSLREAGTNPYTVTDTTKTNGKVTTTTVGYMNCGSGTASKIPYVILMLLMVATTYYQSWQMQKGSGSPATQQQKLMTLLLPAMMLLWGFMFPAGLVLYWTVSNLWQIGQQHFIGSSVREHMGEIVAKEQEREAQVKRKRGSKTPQRRGQGPRSKTQQGRGGAAGGSGGTAAKGAGRDASSRGREGDSVPKKGFMTAWLEKAETERARREAQQSNRSKRKPGGSGGGDRKDRS